MAVAAQPSNVVPGLSLTNLTGAFAITKTGVGTLQLGTSATDASNTFGVAGAAGITVSAGLVAASADQNLGVSGNGTAGNGVTLAGGGFLALPGYPSSNALFTIATGGGTFAIAGSGHNFTLNTGLAFPAANAVTKTEDGTLILTTAATGTATGTTTISAGALQISNSNQIGTGAITVSNVGSALAAHRRRCVRPGTGRERIGSQWPWCVGKYQWRRHLQRGDHRHHLWRHRQR